MFSASAGVRQGRLRRQLFRSAGVDVPHCSRSAPTSASRTASAPAPATTTSATRGCSNRGRRARDRRRIRTADWTHRLGGARELLLDLRHASEDRGQHRGALSLRLQLRGGKLPLHRRPGRAAASPHRSCRTSSTSCSSCALDVRHRLSNRLAASFSYLYEPFRVYDFAFDPTVVNGIVQPSSLVLGYVYRPVYRALRSWSALRYFW